MKIGRLRHKVAIQVPSPTADDYGEPIDSWSLHRYAWAAVEPISGREYFSAQQVNAEITHRVTVRFVDIKGAVPKMRILWNARTFDVQSVINKDERGAVAELMAVESV